MPILASKMSLKWLKMLSLPWKVVFSRYLWEKINFLCGMHIFFQKFSKNDQFLPKMTKIIGFQAKIEKTPFYKIWEPCFIYKCDFWSNWASRGVLQSLCGIFHFLAIFTHFDPQNVQNFGFFAIFSIFRDQKWAKITKYGKFPHNICKTPPRGSIWPKITFVDETGFSNCVETCFFNFRLETYDFRHFW